MHKMYYIYLISFTNKLLNYSIIVADTVVYVRDRGVRREKDDD